MKKLNFSSPFFYSKGCLILIILFITLLSSYTSNAQNMINLNSSSKSNSKNVNATIDFSDAKRSRQLVLNEKVQTNRAVSVNDTILLDLFSNKQYKALVEKTEVDVNGTLSIRARIIGYDYAYCFITTFNGKSFITIDIPGNGEYYSSKYSPETITYYLLEIDHTKRTAIDGSEPLEPPAKKQEDIKKNNDGSPGSNNPVALNAENDTETITVMVVYTPAAAAWSAANETNINNTISLMMEKSRLVHANSNTLVNLQLVHSAQVNYTEQNNNNDLDNLTNTNDGFMDNVHILRNTYAADLVVFMEVASFTGGVAWLLNNPAGSAAYGFSLTRVQQASWTYTVVHEMGHNMGCGHHKFQTTQSGPGLFPYSSGSRWTSFDNKKYCSVLTYEAGSNFADGINTVRVPYFSNPSLSYGGVVIGNAADADNARTIRQTKTAIANYRNGKINQTINAPGWQSRTFGEADFNHNITSSSGLPVTIISSNPAVATIVGNKIQILSAGSCTISCNQSGDSNYNPASLSLSLTVDKATQTLTFPALLTVAVNAPDFDPGATSSIGLPVTYVTSNPNVATIVGGKIHIVAQGTATITASQSGNSNYSAATSIGRSFTVAGLAQAITFNAIPNKVVGDADFEIGATASSGLPLSYASSNTAVATIVGTKIHILTDGNSIISVFQSGNTTYAPAPTVSHNLTVTKLQQAITFNIFANKLFGDPDFEIGATASSGLALTYTSSNPAIATIIGTKVQILAAGTVNITAMQSGNLTYEAAPNMVRSLVINKAQQTISFAEIGFKQHNDVDFTLSATSNVGLPITYRSSNANIANVTGNLVHIVSEGSATITAMQVGNGNYNTAPEVGRNLIVGYTLPSNNFKIQASDETCKTSNNGVLAITAAQSLNYTATITGVNKNVTQNFNTTLQTTGLEAGTYNICITIAGSSFKQCFEAIIKEPKDLSVFSTIKDNGNSVLLQLEGSKSYTINTNGQIITTNQQEITIPLLKGNNIVKISGALNCQGVITKSFLTTDLITLYPNPFKDVLSITTCSGQSKNVKVDIHALDGRLVHSSMQKSEYGQVSIELSKLTKGLYLLTLTVGNSRTLHKILKD